MIIKRETNDRFHWILSCLVDNLKHPVGHLVNLVSTVDGGTVISSSSFLCSVSQHLSSVLRDRELSEDYVTVLLPFESSIIFKMIEFISTGTVNVGTLDGVLELSKLIQIMGIATGMIEVRDMTVKGFQDSNIENVSGRTVNMNRKKVKEMKKVNGKWICQLCQKEFFKKNRCLDHLVRKHKLDSIPSTFTCNLCNIGYNNKWDLKKHQVGKRHSKTLLTESEKKKANNVLPIVDGNPGRWRRVVPKEIIKVDNTWLCQLCGHSSKVKDTCLLHLVKQHNIKIPFSYVCKLCDKGFFRKRSIEEHQKGKKHNIRREDFRPEIDVDITFVPLEYFLSKYLVSIDLKGPKSSSIMKEPRSGYGKRLIIDGKWVCKMCEANFEGMGDCNEHLDKVHNVKVAKQTCDTCQVTYYKEPKKLIRKHLRTKKHLLRVMENISVIPSQIVGEQGYQYSIAPCMVKIKKIVASSYSHNKPTENIGISREEDTHKNEEDKNDSNNSMITVADASDSPPSTLSHSIDIKLSPNIATNIYYDASRVNNPLNSSTQDTIKNEMVSPCEENSSVTGVLLLKDSQFSRVKQEDDHTFSLRRKMFYVEVDQIASDLNGNNTDVKPSSVIQISQVKEETNHCDEITVNIKFVCDDLRLGKSKVMSLPANKSIKKAMKRFSKVVGLEVEDLQFRVNNKDIDISLNAGQLNGANIHVSRQRLH